MKRYIQIAFVSLSFAAIGVFDSSLAEAQTSDMHRQGQMMADRDMQPGQGMRQETGEQTMGPMRGQMMGPMGGHMMTRMMSHMINQDGMMGGGRMGHGIGFQRDKPLSNPDIHRVIDGRLALSGLSTLKVGRVADGGENSAKVDVVTAKDDHVFSLKVDRKTGEAVIVE